MRAETYPNLSEIDKLDGVFLDQYLSSWKFKKSYRIITLGEDIVFGGSPESWHIFYVELTSICSVKLHLQSYLEMLWSETGYFGLLGNKHILYIILLYPIER